MKLLELFKDQLLHREKIDLFEMANLGPRTTGIPNFIIWISTGEGLRHGPRIKIVKGSRWKKGESSTIPLEGMPRVIGNADVNQDEFSEIVEWINLNRDLLIKYWKNEILTDDLIPLLKKNYHN